MLSPSSPYWRAVRVSPDEPREMREDIAFIREMLARYKESLVEQEQILELTDKIRRHVRERMGASTSRDNTSGN
jgi:hypothetical protein